MTTTNWSRGDILAADDLDAAFGRCIDRNGDTMAGLLTLASDPVGPLDAATKQYIDNRLSPGGAFVLKTGDTMSGTLTMATTANGGVPVMGAPYFGDSNHFWWTGANFGFGRIVSTRTNAVDIAPVLSVQRNTSYTGAIVGNPSALTITDVVGANVTGAENCFISQLTINATLGLYTSGTITAFKAAAGSQLIALNVNSQDRSLRMSSVAGSNVPCEFDLTACGPDDAHLRVGIDMIMAEYQSSSDGATSFAYGGIRVRGRELKNPSTGLTSAPTTATVGNAVTTTVGSGIGTVGSYATAYLADGATTAAFSATSAQQTMLTNASALAGATTLTLVASSTAPTYIWPGSLVTGTNIAANTHVATQSWDGNVTTTITLDTPTSGAIANGASLVFTNLIQNGFVAAGYIGTAAFQSPGFSVGPAGGVTGAMFGVGGAGPTITSGSGAPGGVQPKGSIYLRTGGAVASTLYVTQGGGTWNAVAGV